MRLITSKKIFYVLLRVQSGCFGNDSDVVILSLPCSCSQRTDSPRFLMDGLGTTCSSLVSVFGTIEYSPSGHHNIEFRFVDLKHAELCLESPSHDVSCHLSGNNGCKILL